MTSAHEHIQQLLCREGIICTAEHPDLRNAVFHLHRTGRLCRVFPGIYAAPGGDRQIEVLIAAVARTSRSVVLTGAAAARVTFWPEIDVPVLTVASPHARDNRPGVVFHRREIPDRLIWQRPPDPLRPWLPTGLRCTAPALTVLELTDELGGDPIDEALRRRAATLRELHQALDLMPGRRFNRARRRLLVDSRDEPWSAAERKTHRILRRAGFTGWKANYLVRTAGRSYRLDIAWPGVKLAIEVDGRRFHSQPAVFEADRQRQNDLVAAGWTVIRLTWAMLADEEAVVRLIGRLLRRSSSPTGITR